MEGQPIGFFSPNPSLFDNNAALIVPLIDRASFFC
jgi:hypothetical protein